MKFTLPGQFRGPECREIIPVLVDIRKQMAEQIKDVNDNTLLEIVIILRVDGSLGSFGKSGMENFSVAEKVAECELVVESHKWGALSAKEIARILQPRILKAYLACVDKFASKKEQLKKVSLM